MRKTATPAADPAAEAPKKASRPLRRKTSHSVIERRRREKINERLIRLQETVPACRAEATELLEGKLQAVKGKKRLADDERSREVERRIQEEMVLEKLCIISHTVDHMMELKAQIAAYRRLCGELPSVEQPSPPPAHAHAHFAHGDVSPSSASTSLSQEALQESGAPAAAPARRKRHWGSNRIPRCEPSKKAARQCEADQPCLHNHTESDDEEQHSDSGESAASSASELAFDAPSLPVESLYHSAPSRKRRATDAGFTPGLEGPGEASLHACGHLHTPGGPPPGLGWPGAAHHPGHGSTARALPHLWGLPTPRRSLAALPSLSSSWRGAGGEPDQHRLASLRLPPLRHLGGCGGGPAVVLRPRSLSPLQSPAAYDEPARKRSTDGSGDGALAVLAAVSESAGR